MTGSTPGMIITSIVVVIVLAAWIILVFYADAHPTWRRKAPSGHGPGQPSGPRDRRQGGGKPGPRVRRDGGITSGAAGGRSPRRAGCRDRPGQDGGRMMAGAGPGSRQPRRCWSW
jgi:hypothetical protein